MGTRLSLWSFRVLSHALHSSMSSTASAQDMTWSRILDTLGSYLHSVYMVVIGIVPSGALISARHWVMRDVVHGKLVLW